MSHAACKQPSNMSLKQMNITQGTDGELSIQFPLHYESMKIKLSIDNGDTWYEFDDNSIILTYDNENDTLSHSSGLTLNAPQNYTFKAQYVSLGKDYLDSDVITKSFRIKKPQQFTGIDEGVTDYYHTTIRSQKFFSGMYESEDGFSFEITSTTFIEDYSYTVTYNRCVVAKFDLLENETRVSIKHYKDGELSYNDNLEMRLYASSESIYEGLSDWVTASEGNFIGYNLHNDYEIRLLVRLKETNDYLPSETLLAVLTDDGIKNENILYIYEKFLSPDWADYLELNYTFEGVKDNEFLRGEYRQNIITELENNSVDVVLGNILASTKTVEGGELRGYIFEFYSFADALAFYNFKSAQGKNVSIDGKYVAEVRMFDGDTTGAEELDCDDTTFFDAIGFNAE